jgi:DNA primase
MTSTNPLERSLEKTLGESMPGYSEPTYSCPFCRSRGHKDYPGHLHVNYRKEVALCHRCGYGSKNIRSMVYLLTGHAPDLLLQEAREKGFLKTVEDLLEDVVVKEKKEKVEKCQLPREFIQLTYPPKKMMATLCAEYLEKRGVDQQTVEKLGVGYAFKGRFAGMVILPIYMGDRLLFFTSRRVVPGPGPKTIHADIKRSSVMFNINSALYAKRVFINEGPFDALSWPCDIGIGVATMNHNLSEEQATVLLKLKRVEEFVMCYDADAYEATLKGAKLLNDLIEDDRKVSIIRLHKGDPNSERKDLVRYFEKRKRYSQSLMVDLLIRRNQ